MVGASRTSPVPGNGIRRRHARRRILPSFGALLGDNTPTAALRGLRMFTSRTSSYTMLLELFGGRRKKGTTSLFPLLVWCLRLAGGPTFCMGAPGGLYRPTPQGYKGNMTGRRPSRQSLRPPTSPPTAETRLSGGPADWSGTEPRGRTHRLGVLLATDHCVALLMTRAWSKDHGYSTAVMVGDYYSHSPSCLVKGAWDPWDEQADS